MIVVSRTAVVQAIDRTVRSQPGVAGCSSGCTLKCSSRKRQWPGTYAAVCAHCASSGLKYRQLDSARLLK